MGRKSRRSRSVYDPAIEQEVTFAQSSDALAITDPLTLEAQDELNYLEEIIDPNSEQRDFQRRRRYQILVPMIFAAVLIVAATARLGNKRSDESSSSVRSYPSQTVLPAPPSDIDTKCSVAGVASALGRTACEMICEAADCCGFQSSLPLSCLSSNQAYCTEYLSSCSVLDEEPNKNEVGQGVSGDEDSVDQSPSANPETTSPTQSSVELNPGQGATYSPSVDLVLQVQVDEVCALDDMGDIIECTEICSPALCCYLPFKAEARCKEEPLNMNCETYRGCNAL